MDLLIIGAGGHGKVAAEILRAGNDRVVGFLDADESLRGRRVHGIEVLGDITRLARLRREGVGGAFVAIGDNRTRMRYIDEARAAGVTLINAVHPSAIVSPTVRLGQNVLIAAGAVLGVDSSIGDGAILNTAAVVDHECVIEAGVHVCPAAAIAGRVHVHTGAFIGLGARVIQCLRIGAWVTVGAGAVVLRDVPDGQTVVGVPARQLSERREG